MELRFTLSLTLVSCCSLCGASAASRVLDDAAGTAPIVRIHDGLVAGRRESLSGRQVDTFLGIPYAQPPLGDLRFEKPLPAKPWNGTYEATTKPSPCMQIDFPFVLDTKIDNYYASEDCLYVNVWRPASSCGSAQKRCQPVLPVYVFIHGGGFQWGDSTLFVHDLSNFVALSDVIAVGFNYRVSILGFLTAGTKEFPGNWGLWDQNLALRWVQKNIGAFGGNPVDVTLGGQSAGAISAAFHSISPHGKGLFKRLVLQSGSTMSAIFGEAHKGSSKFLSVASAAGCYNGARSLDDQMKEIIACLKKADVREMYEWLGREKAENQIFPPINGDEYLPVDPLNANAADKISVKEVFLGSVTNEGSVFAYNVVKVVSETRAVFSISEDYRLIVPIALSTLFNLPVSQARAIVQHYYGNFKRQHTLDEVLSIFSNIIGDGGFHCPVMYFAEKAAAQGIKTYRYAYTHRSSFNVWPEWVGVFHCEDLFFTTGALPFLKVEKKHRPSLWHTMNKELNMTHYTREEETFMKQLVSMISTYVKTGKPTVPGSDSDWPLYSKGNDKYINLSPNNFTTGTEQRQELCRLWRPYLLKASPILTTSAPEVLMRPKKRPGGKRPPSRTNEVEGSLFSDAPLDSACGTSIAILLASLAFIAQH